MKELIRCEHLSYSYESGGGGEDIPAVSDVSLSVGAGEYIAILGHNGSGKSTFAKLLNLILTPTGGKLFIDGRDVTADDFTEDDLFDVRRKIGMVFQNPDNQLVATVVEEDVAFGPENLGLPRAEIRRRVDDALRVVGMTEYRGHATHKLSGGQKQRVAIAGMLAMKPECIILDESTAMLDPIGRREVMDTVKKLNRDEGMTVLHITHFMEEAARADRIVVISDGRIVMDGKPREVFSRVEELRALSLDAPQTTELLYELKRRGIDVPDDCLFPEEGEDAILRLISRGGAR